MRGLLSLVFLGLLVALIISLCGCNAVPAISVTESIPIHRLADAFASPKYVYVTDSSTDDLLVYPYGAVSAAPIRRVHQDGTPLGVATDSIGNVYVVDSTSSKVLVYLSGARRIIRTLVEGLYLPTGIAIDARDNVFVGTHCQGPHCLAAVLEYRAGKTTVIRTIDALPNFAVEGVAVDAADDVWMDSQEGLGGWGLRFVDGEWDGTKLAFVSSDGIALDGFGNVYVASAGMVMRYAASDLKGSGAIFRRYGLNTAVRFIGSGPNGTIVVPVQGERKKKPLVEVIPETSRPYRITRGLRSPEGAAVGV